MKAGRFDGDRVQLAEHRADTPSPANRYYAYGLIAALTAILVDQISKWYVVRIAFLAPVEINAFLDLRLRSNSGISFGFLGGATWIGQGLILALSLILICGLVGWLDRAQRPKTSVALGLMIGGGVGNALDRIRAGAVTDFIDVQLGWWHWPTFNLADVALVAGVGLLLLGGGRTSRVEERDPQSTPEQESQASCPR